MIRASILSVLLAFSLVPQAKPQTEAILQDYFGSKNAIAKMDLPGTNDGVDLDLMADGRGRVDYDSYQKRLKKFGIAIRNGETATITKIKLKGKHLEFHLNGGGYGTLGDPTDTTVSWSPVPKSQREIDIEETLERGLSRERCDRLEEERDDLRRQRERQNERRRRDAEIATQEKVAAIQAKREQDGSRFNIYFASNPAENDLTRERIMRALQDCLIFSGQQTSEINAGQIGRVEPQLSVVESSRLNGALKRGMSREDVDAIFGAAVMQQESREGKFKVLNCIYESGQERITIEYVDGVLIHYSISSR
jgi:hypothetical protein